MKITWLSKRLSGQHEYFQTNKNGDPMYDLPVQYFRITAPFYVKVGKKIYCIPPDFCCDGKSFGNHYDEYLYAAVLHDWLYFTGYVSRLFADLIFFFACKACPGGNGFWASVYFVGLKIAGGASYSRHRKFDNSTRKKALQQASDLLIRDYLKDKEA